MARHDAYPPEVHEWVREHAWGRRDQDLAEMCNAELGTRFTKATMKAFRQNHGYKNGLGRLAGEEYWKYQTKYPPGMVEYVRENSWHVPSKEMAERVNELFKVDFSPRRMKVFRQRLGIKCGNKGWFRAGRPPANKGRKQSEYCTPEAIERSKATWFDRGHVPHNYLPVGSVTVVNGYKMLKISDEGSQWERWRPLHRFVWEAWHGPVPKRMMVVFKDGDPMNCKIDNLMLASRSENLMVNRHIGRPSDPDAMEVAVAAARLKITAEKAKKRRRRSNEKTDNGAGSAGGAGNGGSGGGPG